ncbi:MAG TPA: amidohydrolase, partial [Terriglobus sp.]
MTSRTLLIGCMALVAVGAANAQRTNNAQTQRYLYGRNATVKVLRHVRILDGTGGPVLQDQTIVIEGAKISAIGPTVNVPSDAEVWDLPGYT